MLSNVSISGEKTRIQQIALIIFTVFIQIPIGLQIRYDFLKLFHFLANVASK